MIVITKYTPRRAWLYIQYVITNVVEQNKNNLDFQYITGTNKFVFV